MEGNKFLVGMGVKDITILKPPTRLSQKEALEFAAWIVALSGGREKFLKVLDEVENS